MRKHLRKLPGTAALLLIPACVVLAGCGGDDSSSSDVTVVSGISSSSSSSSSTSSSSSSSSSGTASTCTTGVQGAYITCLANNYLASLSTSQQSSSIYAMTSDNASKYWSNLPTTFVTRHGIALGALTTAQKSAAELLINAVLSTQGQTTMAGLRAADGYLGANGGGASSYGSDLYYVSFLGTPSTTGSWILQLTGHHYTYFYSVNASNNVVSLTPNFVGVEPLTFTYNSIAYAPMAGRQTALKAMLAGLTATQLASAKIGSAVDDLVVGPQADGKFPTTRAGVLVSSLTAAQQDLVKAAIATYASDGNGTGQYDAYVTSAALADTYVSFASYSDLATKGSYVRIDGPRVWIEFSVQSGIIFSANHYHSVWRDKTADYGGNFSF